ncbi:Zinc finger protein containing five transmembrane domains [Coemansia sp. Benny D115]|nr:Zinc finger protein containing five transmembrane domains [Coemansia sp. Benny D115]
MFIQPYRRRIGSLYFQTLITTAMAHGGMTVGANLELQLQQIFLAVLCSVYVLFVEAVVFALSRDRSVHFNVAAKLTRGVGLGIFCFIISLMYVYTPRLGLAMKINASLVFVALTVYPVTSARYDVRPLPGMLYAQLVGAGISTAVNVFVMPSTSSRKLVGALRGLLKQMSECCQYFDSSADELGMQTPRQSSVAEEALNRRTSLRRAAERFGRVVGGSRYETTIERFSQVDFHRIFIQANKLASSFGTMCLPFEIDGEFHEHLLPQAATRTLHGTMTDPKSSMASILSTYSEQVYKHEMNMSKEVPRMPMAGINSASEAADMHMRQEISQQGATQAFKLIRAQIALHRHIILVLLERTASVERESPTKSLFDMAARAIHVYRHKLPGDIGRSARGVTDIGDIGIEDLLNTNEEEMERMHQSIARLALDQMAALVEQHAKEYEIAVTACIKAIAPYGKQEDLNTHEKHVMLLSFIGALRENAVCLAAMLHTLYRIDAKRPDRVQIWFPKLDWKWLYKGRVDEDDDQEDCEINVEDVHLDLENAFGEDSASDNMSEGETEDEDEDDDGDGDGNNSIELGNNNRRGSRRTDYTVSMSQSTPDSEGMLEIVHRRGVGASASSEQISIVSHSSSDTETSSSIMRDGRRDRQATPTDTIRSRQRRRSQRAREETEVSAIYKKIDHPCARVARLVLDCLKRRKTQYAIKFTVAMMCWAIWAYIGPTEHFYEINNGVWGLSCIGAVLGVTIGSTLHAGLTRVLGASISGVAPVMVISFASVLFSAYFDKSASAGTSLGWKHVAVNAVAIVFAFVVSALFMPYKARTALRRRLAELLRLNSLIVQSINHMHIARAEFPAVHQRERRRVEGFVYRSRVLIAKSRALVPAAEREPSVHEKFQTEAHRKLIQTLELQLEWLMYSFFTHIDIKRDRDGGGRNTLAVMIRMALTMREDIIGAKSAFNSMLAQALHAKSRLPAYLPDIGTARHEFIEKMHPLMKGRYTKSFDVTYLSRWHVGIWHVIITQNDLCLAVRAIVGAETDKWPEEVGFMLDSLEIGPLGRTGAYLSQSRLHHGGGVLSSSSVVSLSRSGDDEWLFKGKWFRRLPKYVKQN